MTEDLFTVLSKDEKVIKTYQNVGIQITPQFIAYLLNGFDLNGYCSEHDARTQINGPYVLESIVSTNTMVLYKVISSYDEKISDTNIFIAYMIKDDYIKPNEVYIYEHALDAILEKTKQMVLNTIANTKPKKEGGN